MTEMTEMTQFGGVGLDKHMEESTSDVQNEHKNENEMDEKIG
jgi:hypothetical protein